MFIDEQISNNVRMNVKCFGAGLDSVWFWIIKIHKFSYAPKGAEKTLRKSALKFLTVRLRGANWAKRRLFCPDCIAKQP